jgi:hemolysin activation/secretion protein
MMRTVNGMARPVAHTCVQSAVWVLCAMASLAHAQVSPIQQPSAGDVQRSIAPEVQAPVKPKDESAVKVEKPAAPSASATAVRFDVKSLSITGNTVFSTAVLMDLVSDVPGHTQTLAELQSATDRITGYYQSAGYPTTRAVLPVQEVRDGVVQILVIEGRVGKVNVINHSLISDEQARKLVGALPAGSVVHEPSLERKLLLLGETPGASRATVLLQPGERTGETDLGIQVDSGPRVSGQIDADNHGNRYTGYYRASALMNVNSPLGLGDQFQVRGMLTDENLHNIKLAYRVPAGGQGWVLGTSWSDVHYDLGREFAALQANGVSRVGNLFASYPLRRSLEHNLLVTLSYDSKTFEDRQEVTDPDTVARKHSKITSVGLNGYGTFFGGSTYAFASVLSQGHLFLDSNDQRVRDAATARTAGAFTKLVATGYGTTPLSQNWSLFGSAYGQLSSKNLDSSERVSLGGIAAVRAYPQGEATGDEGYIFSAEARYTVPKQGLQLAGFFDVGGVRYNKFALASTNSRFLRGTGFSALWAPRPDMAFKFIVATRLGDERVTSEPSDSRTRMWLQYLWRF